MTWRDAEALAESDPYQSHGGRSIWWCASERKEEGSRQGHRRPPVLPRVEGGETKQVIFSVKSGANIVPADLSELRGVIECEKAIGVLITMHPSSRAMRADAVTACTYQSPWGRHPRLQILTVEELLNGAGVDYPPARLASVTYKPTALANLSTKQLELFDTGMRNTRREMAKANTPLLKLIERQRKRRSARRYPQTNGPARNSRHLCPICQRL